MGTLNQFQNESRKKTEAVMWNFLPNIKPPRTRNESKSTRSFKKSSPKREKSFRQISKKRKGESKPGLSKRLERSRSWKQGNR